MMTRTPSYRAAAVRDEKRLMEWVEYGVARFSDYLAKWARFEQWLIEHPPDEAARNAAQKETHQP